MNKYPNFENINYVDDVIYLGYNDKGQLSEVENIDGDIVKYFYNEKGYLIKTILPNNHEIN